MKKSILTTTNMPFCPGCGHGIAIRNLARALEEGGYGPLGVIVVSDIGCAGLVDPILATHTIHGLHGRAPALAQGIALGLPDTGRKVVAIQGDGGSTIGLQHVLEAARRNVDMVLLVLNNQLYGMTGGQMSALSAQAFKAGRHIEDDSPPFDIIRLAHEAGAAYSVRVTAPSGFRAVFAEALRTPGFAVVEVACLCPSHGVKKLKELTAVAKAELALAHERPPARVRYRDAAPLFDRGQEVATPYHSGIEKQVGMVIAGSAGGGVQTAARLIANAGILSGLHATLKGEYPITVGTGFSVAEVILSREEIHYTGLESPDVVIAVTEEGLGKVRDRIKPQAVLVLDSKLSGGAFPAARHSDFQKEAGKQGSALLAAARWLLQEGLLERAALVEAAGKLKLRGVLVDILDKAGRSSRRFNG